MGSLVHFKGYFDDQCQNELYDRVMTECHDSCDDEDDHDEDPLPCCADHGYFCGHGRPPKQCASTLPSKIPSLATGRAHLVAMSSTWMKTIALPVTATTWGRLVHNKALSRMI